MGKLRYGGGREMLDPTGCVGSRMEESASDVFDTLTDTRAATLGRAVGEQLAIAGMGEEISKCFAVGGIVPDPSVEFRLLDWLLIAMGVDRATNRMLIGVLIMKDVVAPCRKSLCEVSRRKALDYLDKIPHGGI